MFTWRLSLPQRALQPPRSRHCRAAPLDSGRTALTLPGQQTQCSPKLLHFLHDGRIRFRATSASFYFANIWINRRRITSVTRGQPRRTRAAFQSRLDKFITDFACADRCVQRTSASRVHFGHHSGFVLAACTSSSTPYFLPANANDAHTVSGKGVVITVSAPTVTVCLPGRRDS